MRRASASPRVVRRAAPPTRRSRPPLTCSATCSLRSPHQRQRRHDDDRLRRERQRAITRRARAARRQLRPMIPMGISAGQSRSLSRAQPVRRHRPERAPRQRRISTTLTATRSPRSPGRQRIRAGVSVQTSSSFNDLAMTLSTTTPTVAPRAATRHEHDELHIRRRRQPVDGASSPRLLRARAETSRQLHIRRRQRSLLDDLAAVIQPCLHLASHRDPGQRRRRTPTTPTASRSDHPTGRERLGLALQLRYDEHLQQRRPAHEPDRSGGDRIWDRDDDELLRRRWQHDRGYRPEREPGHVQPRHDGQLRGHDLQRLRRAEP